MIILIYQMSFKKNISLQSTKDYAEILKNQSQIFRKLPNEENRRKYIDLLIRLKSNLMAFPIDKLNAFDEVLNQLVNDYRTSIDEKIAIKNMISIKLFQLYISFQELKEKCDAQKDSLRDIKPVDSIPVSDRQPLSLPTDNSQEKCKLWLNRLIYNADWLSTEELLVLAELSDKNLTINIENNEAFYSITSQNDFETKVTIRYKNNHYERVIDGQVQDTVGDGYCGWHALFGDKNSEGKFELQGGKECRYIYIRAGINNIDYCIEDLYKRDLLNDLMLDELISKRKEKN